MRLLWKWKSAFPTVNPMHERLTASGPQTARVWACRTAGVLLIILLGLATGVMARDEPATWLQAIAETPFDEPLQVVSEQRHDAVEGTAYARVPFPFPELKSVLSEPAAWCEIVFLHQNVKACVHQPVDGADAALRLYVGRRHYHPPAEANAVDLQMRLQVDSEQRLEVVLEGDRGPYGTRDYRLVLEAVPHGADQSLLRLRYALSFGVRARLAMRVYFATAGRDKVGFTVMSHDEAGEPVYVDGARGMFERNVMRFYLALQTHLETRALPEAERLPASLERWFELTDRYAHQLRELERDTYIEQKQQEYTHQRELQEAEPSPAPFPEVWPGGG